MNETQIHCEEQLLKETLLTLENMTPFNQQNFAEIVEDYFFLEGGPNSLDLLETMLTGSAMDLMHLLVGQQVVDLFHGVALDIEIQAGLEDEKEETDCEEWDRVSETHEPISD